MRERPLETAQGIQDEEHRARTRADEFPARSDTRVESARLLPRAADYSGAVRSVADVQVRVGNVLNHLKRREAGELRVVGQNLHVLDDVLAELKVWVRGVNAAVVDDDGEVALAGNGQATVGACECRIGL